MAKKSSALTDLRCRAQALGWDELHKITLRDAPEIIAAERQDKIFRCPRQLQHAIECDDLAEVEKIARDLLAVVRQDRAVVLRLV